MNKVCKYKLMPEEIFIEKNRTADDSTLSKVLFFDIAHQTRRPVGVTLVDTENCYDRVARTMASLVLQAFGISGQSVETMLATIQDMKFFLRMAFGNSTEFASSTTMTKTQGLCQDNGATPAGWAVVSIIILNAHKKQGHGATICCPISNGSTDLAAIIFVDDTDLLHINMT